jgi:anti-sigma factor RsiW
MTTTTHTVAPEDIMAYLDGELSTAEAQAISLHLDTCANCAALAADLRSTSESLTRWTVPPIPQSIEDALQQPASKTAAANKSTKPTRTSWKWKPFLIGGGGALATLALLWIVISVMTYQPATPHYAVRSEQLSALSTPVSSIQPNQPKERDRLDHFEKNFPPPPAKIPPPNRTKSASYADAPAASMPSAPANPAAPPPPTAAAKLLLHSETLATLSNDPAAPMIARTVSLTIQVKDATAARASLDQILIRHHGYSAQLAADTSENSARTLQASLRIPAPELTAALADLKTLGRVQTESQAGEEVTQQHADLAARLITSRGTEERLRAILQQRTGRVSDILEVEEEIARVRGEIETMEADQQTLEHRVDFATVDILLAEQFKAQLNSPADSATTRIHNAFVAGYRNATDTLLGFLLFIEEFGPATLIWLAIVTVPIVLVWRRYRRTHSNL